jgi:hypothetical protein
MPLEELLKQQLEMGGPGREMSARQTQIINEICALLPTHVETASVLQLAVDAETRTAIRRLLTEWSADERIDFGRSHVVERIISGGWPQ